MVRSFFIFFRQDNDRDLATGPFFVCIVGGVKGDGRFPTILPFFSLGFVGGVEGRFPSNHNRHRRVSEHIVIPGGILWFCPIGGNENDPLAIRDANQRHGAWLTAACPGRGEGEEGQAGKPVESHVTAVGQPQHQPVEVMQSM